MPPALNAGISKRMRRTEAELSSDFPTIRYEIEMLVGAAHMIEEGQAKDDGILENLAIESFAIHCRALIFFLFGHLEQLESPGMNPQKFGRVRENDILAWDYLANWINECPAAPMVVVDAKWRADKHVAHIVTERRGINQRGGSGESRWQIGKAITELFLILTSFLAGVPKPQTSETDRRRIEDLILSWK